MRPLPLHLDLRLRRTGEGWPDCRDQDGAAALECLFGLNAALARQVGVSGWKFEWLIPRQGREPAVPVPAVLESVTTETYPRPEAPSSALVVARAFMRTAAAPSREAVGDLGFRVARRVSGAQWRFNGANERALIDVVAVRIADPLRDRLELYCAPGLLIGALPTVS